MKEERICMCCEVKIENGCWCKDCHGIVMHILDLQERQVNEEEKNPEFFGQDKIKTNKNQVDLYDLIWKQDKV